MSHFAKILMIKGGGKLTSFKKLTEVMRDSKLWSQTKALYTYLFIRADFKSGLSYPPKHQILTEVNLTEKQYKECLSVLINRGYIEETTKEQTDKDGNKYVIECYNIVGDDPSDATDVKETSKTKASNKDLKTMEV